MLSQKTQRLVFLALFQDLLRRFYKPHVLIITVLDVKSII